MVTEITHGNTLPTLIIKYTVHYTVLYSTEFSQMKAILMLSPNSQKMIEQRKKTMCQGTMKIILFIPLKEQRNSEKHFYWFFF